jgi:hypothetical protein
MGFSLNPLKDISSALHAGEKLAGKALHAGEKVAEDSAKGFAGAMKDAAKAVTQMSPSEIGHTVLNVAGMIPVIGAPADAINAGWYAAQGDWKDAALSAATAIPGMGDFVGGARLGATALKIAEDGAKIAEDGVKAERAIKGGEAAIEGAEVATKGTEAATKGTEAATKGTEAATKGTEAATKGTEAATKGEVAASSAERVSKNQAAQDRLIENQQTQLKEAVERGGKAEKGRVLDAQGTQVENITRDTLEQVEGAKVTPNVKIGKGEGSEIDNVVERGDKKAYVESKLTIAEPDTRMINQLKNATKAAGPGDSVILQVAREPSAGEIQRLRNAVGDDVFSKIKIVSKQSDLFNVVTAALK